MARRRRRGTVGWLLCACTLTAWELTTRHPMNVIASGGWTLTLLPVHASAFKRRARRPGRDAVPAAGRDQPPTTM
jgi:hypothetical protein